MIELIKNLLNTNTVNEIANRYGSTDLLVSGKRGTFKITIDDDGNICILKRNEALNPKKKEYYHFVQSFQGEQAYRDVVEFIQ